MAWSVDRLGRSLKDLVAFLSELHALRIDLFLHQQGLDTRTPAGKAMFQMMGVFAEFERAILQRAQQGERVRRPGLREPAGLFRGARDRRLSLKLRDAGNTPRRPRVVRAATKVGPTAPAVRWGRPSPHKRESNWPRPPVARIGPGLFNASIENPRPTPAHSGGPSLVNPGRPAVGHRPSAVPVLTTTNPRPGGYRGRRPQCPLHQSPSRLFTRIETVSA
jgi:resolvase-like protein